MDKNFQNFDLQEAMRLANSPAGQQLLEALRQADGQKLQKASDQAAAGDMAQAGKTLSALMEDPRIRQLLEGLGR